MNKIIKKMNGLLMVITLLVGTAFLTGCNKTEDTSWEDVKTKGVLVMGFTDFPPMGYEDENGVPQGFDVDVAKAVCERLGLTLEAQYIDWDSKVFELESKRIDCVWNGMTITEERQQAMTFSKKYLDNQLVILTLAGSNIKTKADLAGKKVGVENTSSSDIAISKNTDLLNSLKELIKQTSTTESRLALDAGTIDAIIVDEIYARYYVLAQSDKYEIGTDIIGVEEYGIGYLKGATSLRDKIDETIDQLYAEGVITAISMKWFQADLFKRS